MTYAPGFPGADKWCWPNQGVVQNPSWLPVALMKDRKRDLQEYLEKRIRATAIDAVDPVGLPVYRRTPVAVSEYPLTAAIPDSAYWIYQNEMLWHEWISPDQRKQNTTFFSQIRKCPPAFSSFSGIMLQLPPGITAEWVTRAGENPTELVLRFCGVEITEDAEKAYLVRAIYRANRKRFRFAGLARSEMQIGGPREVSDEVTTIRQGTAQVLNTTKEFLVMDDYIRPVCLDEDYDWVTDPSVGACPGRDAHDLRGRFVKFNLDAVDHQRFVTDSVLALLGRPYVAFDARSFKHLKPEKCIASMFVRAPRDGAPTPVQPPHRMPLAPDIINTTMSSDQEEIGGGFVQLFEEMAIQVMNRVLTNALDKRYLVRGPESLPSESVDDIVERSMFELIPGEGERMFDTNLIRDQILEMFGGQGGGQDASPAVRWFSASVTKCYRAMTPPIYAKVMTGGAPDLQNRNKIFWFEMQSEGGLSRKRNGEFTRRHNRRRLRTHAGFPTEAMKSMVGVVGQGTYPYTGLVVHEGPWFNPNFSRYGNPYYGPYSNVDSGYGPHHENWNGPQPYYDFPRRRGRGEGGRGHGRGGTRDQGADSGRLGRANHEGWERSQRSSRTSVAISTAATGPIISEHHKRTSVDKPRSMRESYSYSYSSYSDYETDHKHQSVVHKGTKNKGHPVETSLWYPGKAKKERQRTERNETLRLEQMELARQRRATKLTSIMQSGPSERWEYFGRYGRYQDLPPLTEDERIEFYAAKELQEKIERAEESRDNEEARLARMTPAERAAHDKREATYAAFKESQKTWTAADWAESLAADREFARSVAEGTPPIQKREL